MTMTRTFIAIAVLAGSVAAAFAVGQISGTTAADASATRTYSLRVGDKVTVPAIRQTCSVFREGGAPELFCARLRSPHHQVTIFRDRIQVWKAGKPDSPAWSGRP